MKQRGMQSRSGERERWREHSGSDIRDISGRSHRERFGSYKALRRHFHPCPHCSLTFRALSKVHWCLPLNLRYPRVEKSSQASSGADFPWGVAVLALLCEMENGKCGNFTPVHRSSAEDSAENLPAQGQLWLLLLLPWWIPMCIATVPLKYCNSLRPGQVFHGKW